MSYVKAVLPHLPPILNQAVYDLATGLQAPVPMIASSVLAAASLAAQDKVDLERGRFELLPSA